jgi:hypothetical protein
MKKSFLIGACLFLCGLVSGLGVSGVWNRSVASPNAAASGPPASKPDAASAKAPSYGVIGGPKAEEFLPAEAYKSFILSETGAPRSFEEFKALLAKSKMVNPDAASFEREAVMVYAAALVRAFGLKAIEEIRKSPVLAEFGPAAPGMFEMMYDLHGRDAAVELIESYSNNRIRTMLYGMLATRMIEKSYVEALQMAQQHAPMKLRDPSFVSQVVRSAGKSLDQTALLEFVNAFESPSARLLAAEAAGEMLWSPDAAERERTLSQLMTIADGPLRQTLLNAYLSKAVVLEPGVLLNPVLAGARVNEAHYHTAGKFLSEKGWDAAIAFGMKIPSDEARQRFMMGLVEETVESGDNTVMQKGIDAYNQGIDDGQMLSRAVSAVARLSPQEAVEFLSRRDLPGELRETLSTECINDIATADLDQAKALMSKNSFGGATQDRLYSEMAIHLARENPEAAFSEVVSKINDPLYSSIAAKEVVQEYFRADSNRCLDWLRKSPSSPQRDDLTSAVANEMIKTDTLGALDLATNIADPNHRVITVATIYGNARYIQPSLADSWAKQNPAWIKAISDLEKSAGQQN